MAASSVRQGRRIYREVIRSLKPGEPVPLGTPKRYREGRGYIRLRWKVGTGSYVETYEHRVIDGCVTTAEHVHHDNKKRDDNRPENLTYLTAEEHNTHHAEENRGLRKWEPFRSFNAMYKAAHAENNRYDRSKRLDVIRSLWADGLTTVEIGKRLGLDPSGISRYLNYGRNP